MDEGKLNIGILEYAVPDHAAPRPGSRAAAWLATGIGSIGLIGLLNRLVGYSPVMIALNLLTFLVVMASIVVSLRWGAKGLRTTSGTQWWLSAATMTADLIIAAVLVSYLTMYVALLLAFRGGFGTG